LAGLGAGIASDPDPRALPLLLQRVKGSAAWASGSEHYGGGGEVTAGVLQSTGPAFGGR
jgi:hypothetical protein